MPSFEMKEYAWRCFNQAAKETLRSSHRVSWGQIAKDFGDAPNDIASYDGWRGRCQELFQPYPALLPVVEALTSHRTHPESFFEILAAQYRVLELLMPSLVKNKHKLTRPPQHFRNRFYTGMANSTIEILKMTQADFDAYLEMWNEFISSNCYRPGRFETKLRNIAEKYPSLMEGFIIFSEILRLTLPPVYFAEPLEPTLVLREHDDVSTSSVV